MAYNVIFGGGKIARGFVAHLLSISEHEFIFVEKVNELADLINERKKYTVNILGAPEKNAVITSVEAITFKDNNRISEAIAKAEIIFTAVGGKNLHDIIPIITSGLERRFQLKNRGFINIITCENWKQPAEILRSGICKLLDKKYMDRFNSYVGVTEAVIMRSAIEASKEALKLDPLTVNVQDFWELPIDAARIKGTLPYIQGMKLVQSFEGFLERKFYTYNAANGTVSYLGYRKGYEKIADAAHDEEILKILKGVYEETGRALSSKHKFPFEDQLAFASTSLKKLQDYTIVDFIERNARDPIRKLGPDDRLVGSARMVLEYGIIPENIATAIAAALYYDNPLDTIALELKRVRENNGIDYVLENICKIDPLGQLALLIKEKIVKLQEMRWI